MKFMAVTEPKRKFDKYPHVKLLILTERILVMVDPLQQGHSVKLNTETEHSSAAQMIHLSLHRSHGWMKLHVAIYLNVVRYFYKNQHRKGKHNKQINEELSSR